MKFVFVILVNVVLFFGRLIVFFRILLSKFFFEVGILLILYFFCLRCLRSLKRLVGILRLFVLILCFFGGWL